MKKLWKILQEISGLFFSDAEKSTKKIKTEENSGKYTSKSVEFCFQMPKSPLKK